MENIIFVPLNQSLLTNFKKIKKLPPTLFSEESA